MSEAGRREWRFYLDDMIDFANKVLAYTDGLDQAGFVADGLVYDATLRNLELYPFTTPQFSSTSERQAWLLARRGEDRMRSVPMYVSTGPQPQRGQKPGSALRPV